MKRGPLLLFFAALLILFLTAAQVEALSDASSRLSQKEFGARFDHDIRLLKTMTGNIEKTFDAMEKADGVFLRGRKHDFNIGEKDIFYSLWAGYLDHMVAFDGLTTFYGDFYRHRKESHSRAYLLAYASYIAKLSNGLRFIHTTIDNELYEKKLDEDNPGYGIPAGMYSKLKWNTIHVKDVSNVIAGYQYYKLLTNSFRKEGLMSDENSSWIFDYVDTGYEYIKKELTAKGVQFFLANGFDIAKEKSFSAWFPLQTGVSEWLGDTKVKRLKGSLISHKQISEMRRHLRPGDIIVERRNWYLSNIGLPGFWPHAELYVGNPEEVSLFFSEPSVTKYYRSLGYKDFIDYLGRTYPHLMKEYRKNASDGFPHRIIEAVSEGVKFSSLQEGTSADYIGVLRPRLSKLDVAKAIDVAFSYIGRPYDFNFDFLTDRSIVCSELIYKVYQNGPGKKGIDLRLREIAGRKAMPPNDIVEKFDREFEKGERELDFVYFLDGSEKNKKAAVSGIQEFRVSYKRPKWDIAQK